MHQKYHITDTIKMAESPIPMSNGCESPHGTRKHQTFSPRRVRIRQSSTTLWFFLAILIMFKCVHGSMLCTEGTLVGTKETGHYLLYEATGNQQVSSQEASTESSKRNHDWPDTLGHPSLSLLPNTTLELRIASYNIRAAFPSDRGSDCKHPFGWESRADQVAEQINFYHPDVIGLQEDTYYQIKHLERLLPSYRYVGVNRDDCEESPDEALSPLNPFGISRYDGDCEASKESDALVRGGEFNSIWFHPDELDLQSWGVFWLGNATGRVGSHFLDSTCTLGNFSRSCDVGRIVTWAHFRPKTLPYDFFVFSTHVTSNPEGNTKTPEALIRKIKDIAGSNLSYALGDFATAQFSGTYNVYNEFLNDPDNPHPNEPQALRKWPEEASGDFRRGGRVNPPHGTSGPFVDSESAVHDFIWGYHIKFLCMLNDRLGNATSEERRRLRSDHRMLLATVELKPEYFFQDDGNVVQYPPHLVRSDQSTSVSFQKIGCVMLECLMSLTVWLTFSC